MQNIAYSTFGLLSFPRATDIARKSLIAKVHLMSEEGKESSGWVRKGHQKGKDTSLATLREVQARFAKIFK